MTCRPGHRRGPRVIEGEWGVGGRRDSWTRVDCGARRSGKACSLFILFLENNNGGKETPTEEKRNSSCSIFIFGLEEKKGRNSGGPAASAGMNGWCLAGRCTIWLPGNNRLIGALVVVGRGADGKRPEHPAGGARGVRGCSARTATAKVPVWSWLSESDRRRPTVSNPRVRFCTWKWNLTLIFFPISLARWGSDASINLLFAAAFFTTKKTTHFCSKACGIAVLLTTAVSQPTPFDVCSST